MVLFSGGVGPALAGGHASAATAQSSVTTDVSIDPGTVGPNGDATVTVEVTNNGGKDEFLISPAGTPAGWSVSDGELDLNNDKTVTVGQGETESVEFTVTGGSQSLSGVAKFDVSRASDGLWDSPDYLTTDSGALTVDASAPSITNVRAEYDGETVSVRADVTDATSSVETVDVTYDTGPLHFGTTVEMDHEFGDTYVGEFTLDYGESFEYDVSATDAVGNADETANYDGTVPRGTAAVAVSNDDDESKTVDLYVDGEHRETVTVASGESAGRTFTVDPGSHDVAVEYAEQDRDGTTFSQSETESIPQSGTGTVSFDIPERLAPRLSVDCDDCSLGEYDPDDPPQFRVDVENENGGDLEWSVRSRSVFDVVHRGEDYVIFEPMDGLYGEFEHDVVIAATNDRVEGDRTEQVTVTGTASVEPEPPSAQFASYPSEVPAGEPFTAGATAEAGDAGTPDQPDPAPATDLVYTWYVDDEQVAETTDPTSTSFGSRDRQTLTVDDSGQHTIQVTVTDPNTDLSASTDEETFTVAEQHSLAVSAGANGRVVVDSLDETVTDERSFTLNEGTSVTLRADPDAGYEFAGWSGDVPADQADAASITVPMDQARDLTAGYEEASGAVTVDVRDPDGSQAPEANQLVVYQDDRDDVYAEVTATPSVTLPYTFADLPAGHDYLVEARVNDQRAGTTGWISVDGGTDTDRTITTQGAVGLRVQAVHADGSTPLREATVRVDSQAGTTWRSATTNESGYPDVAATDGTLYLHPTSDGSYTVTVRSDGQQVGSRTLTTLGGDREVTVTTDVTPAELTVDPGEHGGVAVDAGSGLEGVTETKTMTYQTGTRVELQPYPEQGYVFDHWSGDVSADERDDPSLVTEITGDRTITAHYETNTFTDIRETNWAYDRLEGTTLREQGLDGSGVDVAVLGRGINLSHPVVNPTYQSDVQWETGKLNVVERHNPDIGTDFIGIGDQGIHGWGVTNAAWQFAPNASYRYSRIEHGGLEGVGVKLPFVGDYARDFNDVAAYLEETDPDVVVTSLGVPRSVSQSRFDEINDDVEDLVDDDTTVIVAAGNLQDDPSAQYPVAPSAGDGVIAMASTNRDGEVCFGSSPGNATDEDGDSSADKPTLTAPGCDVQAYPYGQISGSSFAAPFVTGVVAQLTQATEGTGRDAADVRDAVFETAVSAPSYNGSVDEDDPGEPGHGTAVDDDLDGKGRVMPVGAYNELFANDRVPRAEVTVSAVGGTAQTATFRVDLTNTSGRAVQRGGVHVQFPDGVQLQGYESGDFASAQPVTVDGRTALELYAGDGNATSGEITVTRPAHGPPTVRARGWLVDRNDSVYNPYRDRYERYVARYPREDLSSDGDRLAEGERPSTDGDNLPFNLHESVVENPGFTVLDYPTQSFTLDVAEPLQANDGAVSTAEDESVTGTFDVTGGTDADARTYEVVDAPANGTLVLDGGTFAYTPDEDYAGTDAFEYRVRAGGESDTGTVEVTVTPVNDPPTAAVGPDWNATIDQLLGLDGTGSTDPDDDSLAYAWDLVAAPAGSNAAIADADDVTTTLDPDVTGTYVVELTVTDPDGADDTTSVEISVSGDPSGGDPGDPGSGTPTETPTETDTPTETETPTETPEPPTDTETPEPPTETETPEPPTETETPEPPTETDTPEPPTETETPEPPTETETPEPPTETETPEPPTETETPEPPTETETPEPPTETETPEPPTETETPEPPTETETEEPTETDTPGTPTATETPASTGGGTSDTKPPSIERFDVAYDEAGDDVVVKVEASERLGSAHAAIYDGSSERVDEVRLVGEVGPGHVYDRTVDVSALDAGSYRVELVDARDGSMNALSEPEQYSASIRVETATPTPTTNRTRTPNATTTTPRPTTTSPSPEPTATRTIDTATRAQSTAPPVTERPADDPAADPPETTGATATASSGPGMTVTVAMLALLAMGLVLWRRRA